MQLIKSLSGHVKKFYEDLCGLSMSSPEEDQLLEIANDGGLKSMSESTANLPAFWIQIKAEYPEITTKAKKTLVPIFVLLS